MFTEGLDNNAPKWVGEDMTSGNLQKKVTSDEYVPSAPPICSPAAEIKEVDGRIPASRAANMQSMAEDIGLSTKDDCC
ncbi:hypothetical protein P3S68_017063 [Capsicum galapagoense]